MPSFKFQKDDIVFISIPDQPASTKGATGPAALRSSTVTSSSAPPAAAKWYTAKVTSASSETAIKVLPLSTNAPITKEIELKANEFDSRLIPRSAVKEFMMNDARFDLAALPRQIKTKMMLDCFLRNGSNTLPETAPSHFPLACGTGGSFFRESCPPYEQEKIIADQNPEKSIVISNYSSFSALVSSKFGSTGETTLDNIKRLLSWFFGEENVTKKTSFIFTSPSSFICLPQFTLSKVGVLPSGDSLSSAAERAANELGISSNNLQLAVVWLQGVEKLWRLTPAASGFKGTEPDLVEAASCLLSSEESAVESAEATKFLANFLSTDRGNTKAPMAQFDEKRIVIAECVTQEICQRLFFGDNNKQQQFEQVIDHLVSDSHSAVVMHLCDLPYQSHADGLEIKTTPIGYAIAEFLKQTFSEKKTTASSLSSSDVSLGKLLSKFQSMISSSSTLSSPEEFTKKPYIDISKSLIAEMTNDFPLLTPAGKDGLTLASSYFPNGEKFKVSNYGWAARLFVYKSFFHKSAGGSQVFEKSCKLIDAFSKSWQNKKFKFFVFGSASSLSEDFLSFLSSAVEYYREQPVEVFDFQKVDSLKCMAFTTKEEKAGNSDPSLSSISSKLLEKIAKIQNSSDTSTFGSYDAENMSLQLSVLGKVGFDRLQEDFASSTLCHIFKRVQYLRSAKLVLRKCCKKTVETVTGTGLLGRLSCQLVAEKSISKRMSDFEQSKIDARSNLMEEEDFARQDVEDDQKRYLARVMGSSGSFLKPLIRRRKDRALRDEMDGRLELMTQESKIRRALFSQFFDEQPDEEVPLPQEALDKVKRRYEFVKNAIAEEEEARKVIVMEARETVVKLVAELELERDYVWKKYPFKPKPSVPWEKLEQAAERRRRDEEMAYGFIFEEQSNHKNTMMKKQLQQERSTSTSSSTTSSTVQQQHQQQQQLQYDSMSHTRSPSIYRNYIKQQEYQTQREEKQKLDARQQLEARLALIQQEQKRELERLSGGSMMKSAASSVAPPPSHQLYPKQQQQQQHRHEDPYTEAKEFLKRYSNSNNTAAAAATPTTTRSNSHQQQTMMKPTSTVTSASSLKSTAHVVNSQNQKAGPAPLRVSFGSYWAQNYKK